MKSLRIYGCIGKVIALSFKKKTDFNKWLALSPVRKSSCMADWVESDLTLNTPGDQASTARAE